MSLFRNRIYIGKAVKKTGRVEIAGWVKEIRILRSIAFLVVRDMTGEIQVIVKDPKKIEKLTKESVISVVGIVKKSKIAKSGVELLMEKIEVISKSDHPVPLDISGKIKSGLDKRLDWRFLDLRMPEKTAIFKIQDKIMETFQKYFRNLGFMEIKPPSIVAASTEGGADLYPVIYFEESAFLAQSPQLYKQMAISSGMERVFMVTPVWRAEKHNTSRHLNESRQCDIEVGFADDNDAIKYMHDFIIHLLKTVKKECKNELELLNVNLKTPNKIDIITYEEACRLIGKKFGEDLTSEDEAKISEKYNDIVFIKDWPTKIRAFYSMPDEKNPKICKAYDLIYNGTEILSGAQRIHLPELLKKQLEKKGLNPKDFKFYIDAFRYGAPPHAGWSFGLERITYKMLNLANIREATLFPRDRTRLTP